MSIERLRALEKELREEERQQLAESRRHAAEGNDETVQAFCNGKAFGLNAAAQRIATLIAELGQEVGAGKCEECGGFGEVCLAGRSAHPSNWHRCEACCQSSATSPAHTSEARDAVADATEDLVAAARVALEALIEHGDATQVDLEQSLRNYDAAMRQEGGSDA